jgi:hypothetical protein
MAFGTKTGGRKKGTRNKATQEMLAKVAATGMTPHEIMIDNMRHAYAKALEVEASITSKLVEGVDPADAFEVVFTEVNKAVGYRQIAQECAKDAAPYSHPRLAAIAHSGEVKREPVTIDELRAEIEADLAELGIPIAPVMPAAPPQGIANRPPRKESGTAH